MKKLLTSAAIIAAGFSLSAACLADGVYTINNSSSDLTVKCTATQQHTIAAGGHDDKSSEVQWGTLKAAFLIPITCTFSDKTGTLGSATIKGAHNGTPATYTATATINSSAFNITDLQNKKPIVNGSTFTITAKGDEAIVFSDKK